MKITDMQILKKRINIKQMLYSKNYIRFLWLVLIVFVMGQCLLHHESNKELLEIQKILPDDTISSSVILMGRYALGVKAVYGNKKEKAIIYQNLIQQTKSMSHNKIDQIGLTPLIAELSGQDAAIKYIDRLITDRDLPDTLCIDLNTFKQIYSESSLYVRQNKIKELQNRYQWNADVALTFDMPDNEPARKKIFNTAINTYYIFMVFTFIILIAIICGVSAFIFILTRHIKKKLITAFPSEKETIPDSHVAFLEVTVFFIIILTLMTNFGSYVSTIIMWFSYITLSILALIWPLQRGINIEYYKKALGWHSGNGFLKEIGFGITGYLAGLPIMMVGCFFTLFIIQHTGNFPVHPLTNKIEHVGSVEIIWLITLACILAPFLEESLFRGAFYRYLRYKNSIILSAIINGFIFAAIHPQGFAAIPALSSIGIVLSLLREWRGSLIAPITAHIINNTFITVMLIIFFRVA